MRSRRPGDGRRRCGRDSALGIAVDSTHRAYVGGETFSDQATFPATVGPSLTYHGAGHVNGDGFVARLSADGTALEYCGYIGGSDGDRVTDLAIDDSDH